MRETLLSRPELTDIVTASSLLVDGVAAALASPLSAGATVDVLPPFAGG